MSIRTLSEIILKLSVSCRTPNLALTDGLNSASLNEVFARRRPYHEQQNVHDDTTTRHNDKPSVFFFYSFDYVAPLLVL